MNTTATSPAPGAAAPGAGGTPVLELQGLKRRFGGVTAVCGVDLVVRPGERVAVIGPNGAGKTTLFRMIAGEMRPSEGTVHLFGRDVSHVSAHRRARAGISRTFQVSNLFGDLTVLDNVRVAAQAQQRVRTRFWWPQADDDPVTERSRDVLRRAGMGARMGERVDDLSHGEKRQVEIAMALVNEPKLLLLDEPAAGLSLGERQLLRGLLEELPRSLPLLLIEHDMTLALELADTVMCLDNGYQISTGTPDQIRADTRVQDVYLGRSGT